MSLRMIILKLQVIYGGGAPHVLPKVK